MNINEIQLMKEKDCDDIYNYLLENTSGTYENNNKRPWDENNHIEWDVIPDKNIKELVRNYIVKLSLITSLKYNQPLYPHYADLVLWNKGKSMQEHIDDGSLEPDENSKHLLKPRWITSVVYLNNDFKGGQTVVNGKNFTPKKGHALIFKSKIP